MTAIPTRHLECLKLVADGHTYAQIGEQLYLSERTVKGYIHRIRHILGAHNAAHAVAIGYRTGLLTGANSDATAAALTEVLGQVAAAHGYDIALRPQSQRAPDRRTA